MESSSEYVPGVCTIGGSEAAQRRRIGIGGALVTMVAVAVIVALDAHPAVGALVALPGFVAATGFIQSRARFCSGYGMAGMSNFRDVLGANHTTVDPNELAVDRARAKRITIQSAGIGILFAAITCVLATLA